MKAVLIFCFGLMGLSAMAQIDTITPPYKKFPVLPPLQVLLADSTKYTKADLPKNRPVVVMLFSPDCEHCQHEAEEMAARKKDLKGIHFVMATNFPLYRAKAFAERYGLAGMENVVVAKDPYYMLIPFYDVRSLPFMAVYDKKGKLLETFSGSVGMDKLLLRLRAK